MSVFNMTDESNTNIACLLIRNPWGEEPNYNTSFMYGSPRWTDSLVAQVPFGIDPRVSFYMDGIFVVPIELLDICF